MDKIQHLSLEAYSSKKKHELLIDIETAVSESAGWIIETIKSEPSIWIFYIEIAPQNLHDLHEGLRNKDIRFTEYSLQQLKEYSQGKAVPDEILLSLTLNFPDKN